MSAETWPEGDEWCPAGPGLVHCHHWWQGGFTCCHCDTEPISPEMAELVQMRWEWLQRWRRKQEIVV